MPDPAEFMRGEWGYDRMPPVSDGPSLNTGFHVRLNIDSVKGSEFSGRVMLWLSGDVMIPPAVFARVRGTVIDPQTVVISIAQAGSTVSLEGLVDADRLTVRTCTSGESAGPFPTGAVFERGS
jgi:hypothetical protein